MNIGHTLPEWADELVIRKLLWTKYGLPFTEITPRDVIRTLALETAMTERQNRGS